MSFNTMQYVLDVPSFCEFMLAKTAVILWKKYLNIDPDCIVKGKWSKIEEEMCQHANTLPISFHLKLSLCASIKYTGRQLRDWIIHLIGFEFDVTHAETTKCLIQSTQWTIHAQLDITETARILSTHQTLPTQTRFDVACVFCIMDQIEHHAAILNDEFQLAEPDETNFKSCMLVFAKDTSLSFRTKSEMFSLAMRHQNPSAVEYFYSEMSDDEKRELFTRLIRPGSDLDNLIDQIIADYEETDGDGSSLPISIIYFLLSQFNEQEIEEILSTEIGCRIHIPLLFDSLYVQFVTPTLSFVSNRLSKPDFYLIFLSIAQKASFQSCIHRVQVNDCLTDLLLNDPEMTNYVRDCSADYVFDSVVPALVSSKDLPNIGLLMNGVSVDNRRRVVSRCVSTFCLQIYEISLDFLILLAKLLITNDEEMRIFKRDCRFVAYSVCIVLDVGDESQWPIADRFLDFCFPPQEIIEVKTNLAFYYITRETAKTSEFVDRFLNWCQMTSPEVKRFLLPDGPVFYWFDRCWEARLPGVVTFFGNKSLDDRRMILSRSFLDAVEMEFAEFDWDFVQEVARRIVSTEEELGVFKENCFRVAYKVCTVLLSGWFVNDRPVIDRFLEFCFPSAEEIIVFKKSLASVFFRTENKYRDIYVADDLRIVNGMLTWCCLTDDEVSDFVKSYVLK